MTAGIVIALGLLLGAGLVVSQLVRLKEWLKKPPLEIPPKLPPTEMDDDDSNGPANT